MDGFLYKLGEFKAEQVDRDYTKLHNETSLKIAKKLGPEAFLLYFTLSTYAYGSSVTAFPSIDKLADDLGVSRTTVKRWKKKLTDENVIRAVPCFLINGMQTTDVIILNAAYPEVPDEWDTFAPNGFVMVKGKPVIREEWEEMLEIAKSLETKPGSKMNPPKNSPVQNYTPHEIARFKSEPPGGSKMIPPRHPENPYHTRDEGRFFDGEENKDKEKKDIVVVVNRLTTYFQQKLGEVPEKDVRNGVLVMLEDDKASEEDIQKAIDYTSGQRVKKNVIGYVRKAVKDRYWERIAIPQPKQQETNSVDKAKPARDERYTAFYQLFPD